MSSRMPGVGSAQASRAGSPAKGPRKGVGTPRKTSGTSTPLRGAGVDQRQLDLSGLNLGPKDDTPSVAEEPPKMSFAREKLLEEAKKALDAENVKKGVSLVVIGHVDAGKSTLMGRLLYELGRLDEKTRTANERGSSKTGKSSFSWAWGLDGTTEERERGITMDIALQSLTTPHRQVTILDAPGHKDFIPNMISGASQADCALLVVDASTGEFEAGFDRGGQTREHLLLVRSLGVSQVIVAINKLDMVRWDKDRYDDICSLLRPFLVQSGFQSSKTKFVPVGAVQGVNLVSLGGDDGKLLKQWYTGPTLVDLLDVLEPPQRDIAAPLRIPIANVFKGTGSTTGISGRICAGVVQVGEKLQILPGDETGVVKQIFVEEEPKPWAVAGDNVTIYMTAVDPLHLNIGSVLCPPNAPVPLATIFTARIIVFDIQVPITAGASVELFHHSRDQPATVSRLLATVDRASGNVVKKNPRVLTKGTPAEVQITLRTTASGPSVTARPIPLETFSVNRDMGRILIRRGGETIAAGIVLEIFG
ncbi:Hsp70 suppressor, GTPase facilitates ribosomal subunit dissociation [Pleurotus pulmonarius]|nr:Hsp70 suppressor, GTPase facilitates ribosomal subunit dissociation [Pleurotus pulmonarius]